MCNIDGHFENDFYRALLDEIAGEEPLQRSGGGGGGGSLTPASKPTTPRIEGVVVIPAVSDETADSGSRGMW